MSQFLNQPAPDFALAVIGGGRLSLMDLRGHLVVLHFWSAECQWSRRADVMIAYRQLTWDRKGVRVVGIATSPTEPENEIRHEMAARRVRYPILMDYGQDVVSRYGVQSTPHFFVLDVRGVVRYAGGLDDVNTPGRVPKKIYLDRAVSALLDNRVPDPAVTPVHGTPIVHPTPAEPSAPALPSNTLTAKS
jgi:peroxiredoxin